MKNNNKEFFEKIPGFLSAIQQITKYGVFTKLECKITTDSVRSRNPGCISSVEIECRGFIPANKKERFIGIEPIINTPALIERIKKLVEANAIQVGYVKYQSETNGVDKYYANKIVGTRGTETNLELGILFN